MISRKDYSNMNEVGVNEYIRNKIDKNCWIGDKYSTCSLEFFDAYANSFDGNSKSDIILNSAITSILFLDTYKIISYKVKKGLATEQETAEFDRLLMINNKEDLKNYYKDNMYNSLRGFEDVHSFINSLAISKINMIKGLSNFENKRLNSVTPLHQNDLDKYNISLDKDYLYNFYKNYSKYLFDKHNDKITESITLIITNYIHNNYRIDPLETKNLIISISSDVFRNIDEFTKTIPSNIKMYDDISTLYQKNEEDFCFKCVADQDILEILLDTYFAMRDLKIIKDKTYEL